MGGQWTLDLAQSPVKTFHISVTDKLVKEKRRKRERERERT